MPVLNSRWTTDGPRRMPSSVPQLTSTAPTGPHSTTAASDAMVLADHASPRAFSKVAEDSQATKSRPSTAIWLQLSPAYGPLASTMTAAAITAPIYSHAMRESLSTLPPRSHPPSTRIAPIAVATPRRPRMSSLGQSSLARKCQRPPTLYRRCQDNVATLISADLKPDHRRPVSGRYVRGGYSVTSISAWTCLIRTRTLLRSSLGTGSHPQCLATSRFTASSRPYSRRQGPHSSRCCLMWSQSSSDTSPSRYQYTRSSTSLHGVSWGFPQLIAHPPRHSPGPGPARRRSPGAAPEAGGGRGGAATSRYLSESP